MKIGNLLETPCKYFPPEEAGNVSVQIECLCWWHAGRTTDLFCYSETSSFVPRLSSPPLLLHSVASTHFGMPLLIHLVFFRMKVARLKNRSERCCVVPIGRADGRICLGLFSLYWHALMPLWCLGPNPYRSPNELLLQSMFYISNVSNGQRYERPGGRTLENLQPDLLQR